MLPAPGSCDGTSGAGAAYFLGFCGMFGSYRLIKLPITVPLRLKSPAKRLPARH